VNQHRNTPAMTNIGKALVGIVIIGALNWGLIGIFNWNLVDAILGGGSSEETSAASRVIYAVVGIAGVASLFMLLPHFRAAPRQVAT
jgi:uncharacterized membrane protein YuzA (DUF378 family)